MLQAGTLGHRRCADQPGCYWAGHTYVMRRALATDQSGERQSSGSGTGVMTGQRHRNGMVHEILESSPGSVGARPRSNEPCRR